MLVKSGQQLYICTNTSTADLQETTSYPPQHGPQSQRQGASGLVCWYECINIPGAHFWQF